MKEKTTNPVALELINMSDTCYSTICDNFGKCWESICDTPFDPEFQTTYNAIIKRKISEFKKVTSRDCFMMIGAVTFVVNNTELFNISTDFLDYLIERTLTNLTTCFDRCLKDLEMFLD